MIRVCFRLSRTITVVFCALVLAGCIGKTVQGPIPVPIKQDSPYAGREDALGILLNHAFLAMEAGRLDEAGGWLSRAMRINPTEPVIYFHMAEIRKGQGDSDQARELAGRAMSLGPGRSLALKLESLLESLEG